MQPSRLFALVIPTAQVVETAGFNNGYQNVAVTGVDPNRHDLAVSLMETLGYSVTNSPSERAAFGTLEFSTAPTFVVEELDELLDNPDAHSSSEIALANNGGSDTSSIDGSTRRLRVLVDAESHKFADKIFSNMLGNTEDLSGKAAFLMDLDTFLFTHRNLGDEADEAETASAEQQFPWALFGEVSTFVAETARREKTGRALVLSHLMTTMSGGIGERLVRGFEAADADEFNNAFEELAEAMRQKFPKSESDTDEEESDAEDEPKAATPPSGDFDDI